MNVSGFTDVAAEAVTKIELPLALWVIVIIVVLATVVFR